MLKIDSKKTYTTKDNQSWQTYQSDVDENSFFVSPVATLTNLESGNYNFSLVEYAGDNAGGFCTFETGLSVPESDLAQIKTMLATAHPQLTPVPQIMTGRFDIKAIFSYISADGLLNQEIATSPSPFELNRALFLVNLDASALKLFKGYFGGDDSVGVFTIRYEFYVAGRLPLISVESTFNASVAYSYEKKVIKV
ncbi:hypothetical protein [Colwellia sp. MB02u-14]|uniref:hypothetical protein n=1 Tax=Colwellia sp. MB02u-14 TaxID=2759815 RepID=UPI0015F65C57|nr:hypothetical protein [Colwellia sp. MB02u-14]MBA6304201.1 hypothetical protein [Colwellia sp. MB02u-14]